MNTYQSHVRYIIGTIVQHTAVHCLCTGADSLPDEVEFRPTLSLMYSPLKEFSKNSLAQRQRAMLLAIDDSTITSHCNSVSKA